MNHTTFGESKLFVYRRGLGRGAQRLGLAVQALVIALASGCAEQAVQIAEPVGPDPKGASLVNHGRLLVYTEETAAVYDQDLPSVHRSYSVLDASQHVLMNVDNASGAEVVTLSPGQYTVRVEATLGQTVSVPVRIVAGMTTEAHLDGKWAPEGADQRMLIHGPDGSLIGYRADQPLNTDTNR